MRIAPCTATCGLCNHCPQSKCHWSITSCLTLILWWRPESCHFCYCLRLRLRFSFCCDLDHTTLLDWDNLWSNGPLTSNNDTGLSPVTHFSCCPSCFAFLWLREPSFLRLSWSPARLPQQRVFIVWMPNYKHSYPLSYSRRWRRYRMNLATPIRLLLSNSCWTQIHSNSSAVRRCLASRSRQRTLHLRCWSWISSIDDRDWGS